MQLSNQLTATQFVRSFDNPAPDQPSIALKCYQPCNAYPMQLNNKLDVSTKAAQVSLIDPTPPQEQPWHSCKLGNCNCPLIGTPNLDSFENIQSCTQRSSLLCTASVEPTMETPGAGLSKSRKVKRCSSTYERETK